MSVASVAFVGTGLVLVPIVTVSAPARGFGNNWNPKAIGWFGKPSPGDFRSKGIFQVQLRATQTPHSVTAADVGRD